MLDSNTWSAGRKYLTDYETRHTQWAMWHLRHANNHSVRACPRRSKTPAVGTGHVARPAAADGPIAIGSDRIGSFESMRIDPNGRAVSV